MNLRLKKILNILAYLAIFSVGAIAGVVLFDRVLMPAYTRGGGTQTIPDVTGVTVEDAERIARKGGFDFRVMRLEHSDSIPENYIISQRPLAGSPAKKGRRISVVVSLSAASAIIPDVVGKHFRSAQLEIERVGLKVGEIVHEHSESVATEMVIATSPLPGRELDLGSKVDLIVSMGPETGLIRVPNFMGQLIADADETARRNGLILRAKYRKIPTVPANTVYTQSIDPGALVERGSTIIVIVARGDD